MKKILHLICNSHIDPVWQWDWNEGASAALSTFYTACNLLDKYDFIFCHNEVLLYEYIEKYDPALFKRIQQLVKEGKWKIMGGWYCQPDCFIPSGESFLRQISLGREYFSEKFNSRPTVALNFDSFGHTRGLPQILKKTGFDSYIFCRPLSTYLSFPNYKDLPHGAFLWEGYDGSRVKALRYEDYYRNYQARLGFFRQSILDKESFYKDLDIVPVLWGVGNHGGLASEKDLEDILELQNEKSGEWTMIHSTLEDYFATQNPSVVEKRQFYVFSKAYSSGNYIKQAHDQLENALYFAEKICTVAELSGKYTYNKELLKNAERALCQIEFHDVLAGTSVKTGLDSSVMKAHRAIDELKQEIFAAYYSMAIALPPAPPGDENVVLFNPYPYEFNGFVEQEFYPLLRYDITKNEEYSMSLFDMDNNPVDFQVIKEESNIANVHRIRMIFNVKIPPFSLVSYHAHFGIKETEEKVINRPEVLEDIIYKDDVKEIKISSKTGCISSYKVHKKEYLSGEIKPVMFNDNGDPWGWRMYDLTATQFNENGFPTKELKNNLKEFKLDNRQKGIMENVTGLVQTEDGDLIKEYQASLYNNESHVIATYHIYKNTPYIDIKYHVLWNEHSKGLKVRFPLEGKKQYFAQMAFGNEVYKADGVENPNNRYIGVENGDKAFVIYNNCGVHSSSKKGKNLYLTLLNGSSFCAHPTSSDKPLTRQGIYDPSIEQGVHDFSLRVGVNKFEECERIANEFNQPLYQTLFYPHGKEKAINRNLIGLSNKNIVISALKIRKDGTYLIRLYNGTTFNIETTLMIKGIQKTIKFKKYEFKTFVFDGVKIIEAKDASIY